MTQMSSELRVPEETPLDGGFDLRRDVLNLRYPRYTDRLRKSELDPNAGGSMDAIFVPAGREVGNSYVDRIAAVAKETDTRVIAFTSCKANSEEMADLFDDMSVPKWGVVKIPEGGYGVPFMDFISQDAIPEQARKTPGSDLSVKRNLAHVVGSVMGWKAIFHSDDDLIYGSDSLRAVSRMLAGGTIAGMACSNAAATHGFEDKDVVNHALDRVKRIHSSYSTREHYLKAGNISGNSLAVNPQASCPFFPINFYNEDLLACHDDYVTRRGAIATKAAYYQATFNPYTDPDRARTEGFGELVYDGLFLPMWDGRKADLGRADYWSRIIDERITRVGNLLTALDVPQDRENFGFMTRMPERDPVEEEKIRQSLLAALAITQTFTGEMAVDYVQAWKRDKATWQKLVPELPRQRSVPDALDLLGLSSFYLGNEKAYATA